MNKMIRLSNTGHLTSLTSFLFQAYVILKKKLEIVCPSEDILITHRNHHSKMNHQMELLFCPQTNWPIRGLEYESSNSFSLL